MTADNTINCNRTDAWRYMRAHSLRGGLVNAVYAVETLRPTGWRQALWRWVLGK